MAVCGEVWVVSVDALACSTHVFTSLVLARRVCSLIQNVFSYTECVLLCIIIDCIVFDIGQGQAESGGMVLVAYAGPVRPAAALRDSVLCLPTDIHSLLVNTPSSSSSSTFIRCLSISRQWCAARLTQGGR